MDTQPNDIETMLDDSFFIMNTGHVENDNDTTNNIPINNIIKINNNKKLVYILLFLFLSTSGFILYDHFKQLEQAFVKFGSIFN